MLAPEVDHLDYGEQLNPPPGFEIDAAISTTYSLDLNALLAVPVALCCKGTFDGDLKGERLALLEAIGQLKDKVKVYYQKGNISVPPKFNRLFTLLEPCLEPIVPQGGAFSSFHPKLWLMRFIESKPVRKKPEIKYRLLVLSRNLTFDRSWDVAVTLDGQLGRFADQHLETLQWAEFIDELLSESKSFPAGQIVKKELKRVIWAAPDKFTDVRVLVGNEKYGRPVKIEQKKIDETLVVSPFLASTGGDVAALQWLASSSPEGENYLFSRAEELNAIGAEKLTDWQCYSINENLVNSEEIHELVDTAEGEQQKKQNLHAKIIVQQRGRQSFWHVGSANATAAALGDKSNESPRNTEMMVSMKGPSSKVGPKLLREKWVPAADQGIFVKHVFSELIETDGANQAQLFRRGIHQLICAKWQLNAVMNGDGEYTLTLKVNLDEALNDSLSVTVKQLAFAGEQTLADVMVWKDVALTNISAFIPVHVKLEFKDGLIEKRLIFEADVEIEGGDDRDQQIVKSMVDTPEKVLNYLTLLLQITPDKGQWLSFDGDGEGSSGEAFLSGNPILEQLLIVSSRHPELLKRIEYSLQRLNVAEVEIPADFQQLWQEFRKGMGK